MSFVVMVALLFCSETLGSHPVFGEEDNIYTYDDDDEDDDGWNASEMEGDFFNPFMEIEEFFCMLDPLFAVNLIVVSMFNNSDSCNLTVTCSAHNFEINSIFKCDNKSCHQEGGEQRETWGWPSVSLHVYLSDGSIICNHSNKVKWTKDMVEIGHFCPQNAGSESFSDGVSFCMVKTVMFSVGLIIMVFAVTSVHLIKKFQMQN